MRGMRGMRGMREAKNLEDLEVNLGREAMLRETADAVEIVRQPTQLAVWGR